MTDNRVKEFNKNKDDAWGNLGVSSILCAGAILESAHPVFAGIIGGIGALVFTMSAVEICKRSGNRGSMNMQAGSKAEPTVS